MTEPKSGKMGRNPFEKKEQSRSSGLIPKSESTLLFKQFVKPSGSLQKVREMQIQVDWTELYKSVTKDIRKMFFLLPILFLFTGACASKNLSASGDADLKRQMLDLQKVTGRQTALIDELNNKILLLSDRLENRSHAPTAVIVPPTKTVAHSGDAKLYEMVTRDIKNHDLISLSKNVELMQKGYKSSPMTDSAEFLLGEAYFKKALYKKSAEVFEKLYGSSPDGPRAVSTLYYLGLSYKKLNRGQESQEAFQSIVNVYPGSQEALESMKILASMKKGAPGEKF